MRDILLAVALTWCLWLTYDLHFNYKQDKIANLLDKMTLRVLQIHTKRLDRIANVLGLEPLKEEENEDKC